MKTDGLKKLIKEAVREAIQEELKDILLEAVRSPKQVVRESFSPTIPVQPTVNPTFTPPTMDLKSKYADILGETAMSFTSQDAVPFRPQVSDPINGNLGAGEVGMDQIMALMNTK
jgi:hypothetical protein